jgi:TetR/AcrR family transcriptional regulator, tetracycline repressor protein
VARPKTGETELTRKSIIDAALKILQEEGMAALSLARIAKALGIQTPSLYWHFASKAELYTYVSEAMFREVLAELDPELTGRELLWALGLAMRKNLGLRHDATKLISVAGVSEEIRNELVPALLARVARKDMSLSQARNTVTAIQSLTLGWATFEANPATIHFMRRASQESDRVYQQALAALVFDETHIKGD